VANAFNINAHGQADIADIADIADKFMPPIKISKPCAAIMLFSSAPLNSIIYRAKLSITNA
jgi:hypothetical protein